MNNGNSSALVIGGGIAGMQASLDLAEQGVKVYLVEKLPSIGGRMAQLDKTFPTLDCSSCILTPKMVDTARHENIELMTYSEVQSITGDEGNFTAEVLKKARKVNMETCTGCGICWKKCPRRTPSEFDMNLGQRKAIYIPFPQAIPLIPVIDAENCIYYETGKCKACEKHCPTQSIEFEQKEERISLNIGAVIYATGFNMYDPKPNNEFGYGLYKDVITSIELERLLSAVGPTNGHLQKISDGSTPKKVAFIQCVGSRSQLTNYYCSRFCCMVSIKEAILIRDHYPDTECRVFYMDIRAFGKGFQEFYTRAERMGVSFVKGRVGKVEQNQENNSISLRYEDVDRGVLLEEEFDMLVLAVGAIPNLTEFPISLETEDDAFLSIKDVHIDPVTSSKEGVLVAGLAEGPKDIPDTVVHAGAAAMKASVLLRGGK
ncbi:MAG: FAD-dependent oxidoreductase [Candidatus Kariarchaeaceae archaeon]|jgi:heterodisulfide reductase subunit A